MKVYLIYITLPKNIFNTRFKYIMDGVNNVNYKFTNDNKVIVLYAWTTKKKLVKRFLEERCSRIFKIKEKEYDEEDFNDFEYTSHTLELNISDIALFPLNDGYEYKNKVTINDKSNFIEMVTTEYEYNNISLYRSQNMNEFGPQVDPSCDYIIFNDEIQDALYTLGYCTLYDSTYMQTFPESNRSLNRYEKAMHIINFADSSKDKITSMIQTEYIVFIYLYSYTFLGE